MARQIIPQEPPAARSPTDYLLTGIEEIRNRLELITQMTDSETGLHLAETPEYANSMESLLKYEEVAKRAGEHH
ncbi:MAG: hypothetical protein PHH00_01230 [Candidatus Nanoarchaeia archaeon]|nr:hypothetical protein [Candidatus Nanoarchaeia archaeon]